VARTFSNWEPVRLVLLVSAIWSEVHLEGIKRQVDRNRIIRRNVKRRHPGCVDALHGQLLRLDREVLILHPPHHVVADVVFRLLEIPRIHQRNIPEVILKTVIGHHGRSYLKAAHHHEEDHEKSTKRLKGSHKSRNRAA